MLRLLRIYSLVLLLAALPIAARHRETGFLNRTVTLDGATYRYQVYVPAGWSAAQRWPVILFLHGAGERADDGLKQTQVGLAAAIRLHADRYPALVVMPQCREDVWWTDPKMEAQALASLQQTMKEFHADPDRVYLTGLSMGGYGSWAFAAKYPGKWAAAVVVCGGIRLPPPPGQQQAPEEPGVDSYADAAKKIGNTLPVWVFHGDADRAVPVEESRKMVESLKAIDSAVKYTEYPGVPHNSWDKAYAEPDLAAWLFAQRRGQRH
jgi:predicted peptidase